MRTNILGLSLPHPVLVASGPLTDSMHLIEKVLAAGAAGAVTKTIYRGIKTTHTTERFVRYGAGALNSMTYSHRDLSAWLTDIGAMRRRNLPVVVSIFADEPSALGDLAREVVTAGAPALELGLSCPSNAASQRHTSDVLFDYVSTVRKVIDVPMAVKIAAYGDFVANARAIATAGADALSISDALPAVCAGPSDGEPKFDRPVGYSGPPIKPLVLNAIHQIRAAQISIPIIGIGGIASRDDVLEYMRVGATAVQLLTALMLSGLGHMQTIVADLQDVDSAACVTDVYGTPPVEAT